MFGAENAFGFGYYPIVGTAKPIKPEDMHKSNINDWDYAVNDDALLRNFGNGKIRTIITKEEFITCYNKWIKPLEQKPTVKTSTTKSTQKKSK